MRRATLPRSIRKYIRMEKSRIRRAASGDDARAQIAAFVARYRSAS